MHKTKTFFQFEVNFLEGPIFRALVLFAIPLFVSNIFQQLYNTVDTMIVGNCLGDLSLAAIGSCAAIFDLLVGFALGIGNGLSIVTARSFGAGDGDLLKKSVACSIVIGIVSSAVLTAVGILILCPLLAVLNTPEEILEEAYSYISVITWFIIIMFAYNLCAGLMRAIGNSVMPLVFLVVSSLANIVLDLLLIMQFHMGIRGAAVATVISQGMSVILCVFYIWKKVPLLIPGREHFRFDRGLYMEMAGQGLSMGFMNSIVSAGSVILQYGINGLGTLIIAGHTAARKLYMFFNMPFIAMSMSMSTFVSQNKGAGQGKRVRKALKYSYLFDVAAAGVITVLLLSAAPALVKLISGSGEPKLLHNGSLYLTVVGPFYAVLGVLIQSRCALQGIGEKLLPLISSVIELVGKILFVLIFIPRFQYMAVIFCEPAIWCVMTVQLLYSLYRNPFIREAGGKNL